MNSAVAARALLRRAGFRLDHRRALESNVVWDTPAGRHRRRGELVRTRCYDGLSTLTFKTPAKVTRSLYKRRREIEFTVDDSAALASFLSALGLRPVFRYEKFRAVYADSEPSGRAMLDETPVGVFLELEGPARWISRAARRLGFRPADYITSTYGVLYLEYCYRYGQRPNDMVFPDTRSRTSPPVRAKGTHIPQE